jgi:hypothetical protein
MLRKQFEIAMSPQKFLKLFFQFTNWEVINMNDEIIPLVKVVFGDCARTSSATAALFAFGSEQRYC